MNRESTRAGRYALLASLYVSQAVPLGFLIVAIPAILRSQGVGLEQLGLLSALALPWLIKFLWAPLVDRFGSQRFGHYRSWILPLQSLTILAAIAIAFTAPGRGMGWLIAAGAAFMLCSATQDVATDGLAVRMLGPDERGPANGIQVGGYYLGQILGGGVILLLFGRMGWTMAVLAMASFLALPLIPVLRFREPAYRARERNVKVDFKALRRFATRSGAGVWILVLLLFRTGEAMALTMFNPLLVDRGLSLEEIGLVLGLAGSAAAFAGAILGGWSVRRMGRKLSLVVFGLLQAVALCGYLLPAAGLTGMAVIYGVVAASAFAGGMATAALYTNMMDRCDSRTAATDFTLQQSLCAVGPLIGAGASGFIAGRFGYSAHFMICSGIAVVGALVAMQWLTAKSAAPTIDEAVVDPV